LEKDFESFNHIIDFIFKASVEEEELSDEEMEAMADAVMDAAAAAGMSVNDVTTSDPLGVIFINILHVPFAPVFLR